MKKKISIVIPFYNEAANLPKIHEEFSAWAATEPTYDFEVLLMDNASTDGSARVARELVAKDSRLRHIRLTRNFGYQANILTGYMSASGDAAVQLDADGEDDPRLISEFLRNWEQGYQVVYGVRKSRKESYLRQVQRKIFYRLIARLSEVEIPLDAGDFRLVDRSVLDKLAQFKEVSLYLRGIISYIGHRQIGIPYDRRPRYAGESKFSYWNYLSLATDGIVSFSKKPLNYVSALGMLMSIFSFLGIAFYLGLFLAGQIEVKGFTTLVLLTLFTTGVQLLALGVVGSYVGRIFDEVKGRPRSLIDQTNSEKA